MDLPTDQQEIETEQSEEEEVVREITEIQNERSFPISNWFIDFEYMILGQKIKKIQEADHDLKDLKFDHLFYSDLILKNQENRLFMQQETVTKLIEF